MLEVPRTSCCYASIETLHKDISIRFRLIITSKACSEIKTYEEKGADRGKDSHANIIPLRHLRIYAVLCYQQRPFRDRNG